MRCVTTTRLGFCWLLVFMANAYTAEFKPLDAHSRVSLGHVDTFVVADAFKVGNRIGGRTLSAVGLNFVEHFLDVVEHHVPKAQLNAWTLAYTTGDKPLIEASGGNEGTVRYLAHIYRLMEMGDTGPSLIDWRSNFAYVRSPSDHNYGRCTGA